MVAGSLLLAVLTSRPEPVAVAAPFTLVLVLGLAAYREPDAEISVALTPSHAVEGDEVEVRVTVSVAGGAAWVEVTLDHPDGLAPFEGPLGIEAATGRASRVELVARFTCLRWGRTGPVTATAVLRDRFRLVSHQASGSAPGVWVRPSDERLRSLLTPRSLRTVPGSHLSRQRGDGIDFADIRPFVPGDRVRSVNWRASARRGELWINDRHPDRSGDVVLFLDSFEGVGDGVDGTLERGVEAAAALAAGHLGATDRVGLVDLGGLLRWVRLGGGTLQLHRIVEVLVRSELSPTVVDKTIDVVPVRSLPRRALVIALSPLLDDRGIAALEAMRARGTDLVILECSPAPWVEPGEGRVGELAHRLWHLEREALRARFRRQGVAVVDWPQGSAFDLALREALAFREAVLRWAR